MKALQAGLAGVICAAWFAGSACADIVTFNSPGQWTTERSDVIVLKVQLDTAKIPKKKIAVSLYKVEAGKKKLVVTKPFKVNDYSQEFNLGSVGTSLLGGKDYLKIEWAITGAKDKGSLFPVGIVNLDKIPAIAPLHAAKVQAPVDENSAASLAAGAKFTSVNNCEFALFWSTNALSVVLKKGQSKSTLKLAFDGKNGKNAFISYPDRIVELNLAKDSMSTVLYERVALSDSVNFPVKDWKSEVKKTTGKEFTIFTIPWYDIGLVAQDERVLGFAAFVTDEKSAPVAAYPAAAKFLMPGSWSSIVLDK
jgi:hypothetical protein